MIRMDSVTKQYYSLVAIDNISFTIPQGEVVGILGPNGAGKTTLFKLIAGLLFPDKGKIVPSGPGWPTIGFKPERLLFPNHMRVQAYLTMMASLTNLPRSAVVDAVSNSLREVDLADAAGRRIAECSKGMRQRLAVAQSLLGRPELLLLDEPSNGLDPEGQAGILQIVRERQHAGHTVVIASHQLQEVKQVCTQLVILRQGQIHYQSSMRAALALRPHVTIQSDRPLAPVQSLLGSLHPRIEVEGASVILHEEAIRLRRHVLSLMVGMGFDVVRVEQKRRTLDEIYAEVLRWHNES